MVKGFEKLSPELQFYKEMEKQFRKMLEMNNAKIVECQKEYIQSLTTEQVEKTCRQINV
jgi:hypothetical protein